MAEQFPQMLYVKQERDGGTEYFSADADAALLVEMGETVEIATYQLVEVREASGIAEFKPAKERSAE